MSLIPCQHACLYQKDGFCRMDHAGAKGVVAHSCAHFIPVNDCQPVFPAGCAGTPAALEQYLQQEEASDR